MSTWIIVLRAVSVLAFVGPMLLLGRGERHQEPLTRANSDGGSRAPVLANFSAFALFLPSLFIFAGRIEDAMALPLALALTGSLVALTGAAIVFRSRAELGSVWSLVPKSDQNLVTTGPYRLVRHPIYLGLVVLATGQALSFGSWPALVIVACAIIPTFAWRARVEEKLLIDTFGEHYEVYRQRTNMVIPHLL